MRHIVKIFHISFDTGFFFCLLKEFILFTQYDTIVAGLQETFRNFEAWYSESNGH